MSNRKGATNGAVAFYPDKLLLSPIVGCGYFYSLFVCRQYFWIVFVHALFYIGLVFLSRIMPDNGENVKRRI